MSKNRTQNLINRKRRIRRRLRERQWADQPEPMFKASNIHYEVSARARGIGCGGIGSIHLLARRTGLVQAIDEKLHLLKRHLPYHESDHVLNMAYNILAGGTCLEDIELRRNDEVYTDSLGAQRIPDPTTAGDFCRRFSKSDVEQLMNAINEIRLRVWRQQPATFFKRATIEGDGILAPTTAECKSGMDISYNGVWGYHPLVISLAETGEPLYLVNRSGNRRSDEGAADRYDQAIALCQRAGFKQIVLRGDTAFSQSMHLDRWDAQGVQFVFGYGAWSNLVEIADNLPKRRWKQLIRRSPYQVQTSPRERPPRVKEEIIRERKYKNVRLQSEQVAEFDYRPDRSAKTYRMVVLRKNLSVQKGENMLFDDVKYFFTITNMRSTPSTDIVYESNARSHQENLIAQLQSGVRALQMPVDNLVSNWAYMVMASLAWTLKAWWALLLPENGRWSEEHKREKQAVLKMEFKTFLNALMRVPCQIVRTGRRVIYRLLGWNPWLHILLRGVDAMYRPLRC